MKSWQEDKAFVAFLVRHFPRYSQHGPAAVGSDKAIADLYAAFRAGVEHRQNAIARWLS